MEQIKKYCVVKRIVAIIFTFLAATIVASPQEPALVDEFGKHNTEELMARLDNLHNQLYRNDGSIALIRVYRGKADYLGFPSRYLARIKTYLTNHKVNGHRLAFQECDGGDETQYRLYLVPASTKVSNCQKSLIIPQATTLFDSYFYSYEYPGIDDCCSIPGSDITEASASLKAFADLLSKKPERRAYIIAYNGTNVWGFNSRTLRPLDPARKATRTAINAKKLLIQNGIDAKRIKAVNGGYRDSLRNVELWFVSEGGSIPKPTPNYFSNRRKAKRK